MAFHSLSSLARFISWKNPLMGVVCCHLAPQIIQSHCGMCSLRRLMRKFSWVALILSCISSVIVTATSSGVLPISFISLRSRGNPSPTAHSPHLLVFSLLSSQGEDSSTDRKVGYRLPVGQVAEVMQALGNYLSERECEDLMNEIKFDAENRLVVDLSLDEFIQSMTSVSTISYYRHDTLFFYTLNLHRFKTILKLFSNSTYIVRKLN